MAFSVFLVGTIVVGVVSFGLLLWFLFGGSSKKEKIDGKLFLLKPIPFFTIRNQVGNLSVKQWQESRETRQALLQKRMDDALMQKRAAFLAKQKQT